ncbi:MAG TPA: GAF domain-containing sensor histidine kinase [Anaerolineales bacterium]|nr:GAF domain-containing sensor histidine kinase [Anaerolineales bacterium]
MTRSWPPLTPLVWIALTQRWLWLIALPIVAGLAGPLSKPLIVLSLGWTGFALAMTLARLAGAASRRVVYVAAAVDSMLAIGALALSGGVASPLWWTVLIGALGVALLDGRRGALATGGLTVGAGVIVVAGLDPAGLPALAGALVIGAATLLGGAALLWPAQEVRRVAIEAGKAQGVELREARRRERRQMARLFHAAGLLNASLDHERVLDQALEIASQALLDPDDRPDQLVGMLLLLAGDRARIVSGRGLPPADWRLDFAVDSGWIGRVIGGGEPLRARLGDDAELARLAGLHGCRSLVAAPLVHADETIGAMLFGHPADVFGEGEAALLGALAEQTMIALQNARRVQDLGTARDRIQELQEEARRRLARDLHDGPTQSLATIAMRASFARRLLRRDALAAEEEMGRAEDLARRTTREVRHMLFTLRPLILESQGLVSALQQLADKTGSLTGHDVVLEIDDEAVDGLEMSRQGMVFFVAEEAVNNARKHAEAEHIWVRMHRQGGALVMEVEDDGVGFNVGAVDASYAQRGSLGMVSMRERSELLGGTLSVDSAEGRGTTVRLTVPLGTV